MAKRLFETIGKPEMIDDPRFRTNTDRVNNRTLVDEAVGAWFATKTRDEALRIMREASVTAGPVYSIADAMDDAHFRERGIIVDVEDAELGTLPMHNILPRLSANARACGASPRRAWASTRTRCWPKPDSAPPTSRGCARTVPSRKPPRNLRCAPSILTLRSLMTYVDATVAPPRKTGQIKLHGPAAFEGMRKAGRLVAECLDMLADEVEARRADRADRPAGARVRPRPRRACRRR